jgi:hypothetical protein
LVEIGEHLGGRVDDATAPDSTKSDYKVAGECPVRFQEYQYEMRCLLNELGVELEYGSTETLFTYMRGRFATSTDDFAASGIYSGVYQGLPDPDPNNCGLECDFYDYLRGATNINPLTGQLVKIFQKFLSKFFSFFLI